MLIIFIFPRLIYFVSPGYICILFMSMHWIFPGIILSSISHNKFLILNLPDRSLILNIPHIFILNLPSTCLLILYLPGHAFNSEFLIMYLPGHVFNSEFLILYLPGHVFQFWTFSDIFTFCIYRDTFIIFRISPDTFLVLVSHDMSLILILPDIFYYVSLTCQIFYSHQKYYQSESTGRIFLNLHLSTNNFNSVFSEAYLHYASPMNFCNFYPLDIHVYIIVHIPKLEGPSWSWTPRINRNIVESGVKHHKPNQTKAYF